MQKIIPAHYKKGILEPSVRRELALKLLPSDGKLKFYSLLNDDDCCQRGLNGEPLKYYTPLVPYRTLKQWKKMLFIFRFFTVSIIGGYCLFLLTIISILSFVIYKVIL